MDIQGDEPGVPESADRGGFASLLPRLTPTPFGQRVFYVDPEPAVSGILPPSVIAGVNDVYSAVVASRAEREGMGSYWDRPSAERGGSVRDKLLRKRRRKDKARAERDGKQYVQKRATRVHVGIWHPFLPQDNLHYGFPFDLIPLEILLHILNPLPLELLFKMRTQLKNIWWLNLLTYTYPWFEKIELDQIFTPLLLKIPGIDNHNLRELYTKLPNEQILYRLLYSLRWKQCGACFQPLPELDVTPMQTVVPFLGYVTLRCMNCIQRDHPGSFKPLPVYGKEMWNNRGVDTPIVETSSKNMFTAALYGGAPVREVFVPHVERFYQRCHRRRALELGYREDTMDHWINQVRMPRRDTDMTNLDTMDERLHQAARALLPNNMIPESARVYWELMLG